MSAEDGSSPGAIMAEESGYAVAYSRLDGDVVFARVDLRGN